MDELLNEKRHPVAYRRHVREVWLQVALPLVIGVLLGGLALFTLLSAAPGNVTRAAELATVLLAIPLLVLGVVILVALVAVIWLLGRAMHWIPEKSMYVHRVMDQANRAAYQGADLLARPVLAIHSWGDALSRLWQRRLG